MTLERFLEAVRARDPAKVRALLSADTMYKELDRQGLLVGLAPEERQSLAKLLEERMGANVVAQPTWAQWKQLEIRRIDFARAEGLAFALVRITSEAPGRVRMVFRLIRRGDEWRLYDWEDLDTTLRLTTSLGILLPAGGRERQELRLAGMELFRSAQHVLAGNVAEAEAGLQRIARAAFPPTLDGFRWTLLGMVRAAQGNDAEALRCYSKAESLKIPSPALAYLQATSHHRLGGFEEALQLGKQYLEATGGDADAYAVIGDALAGLERNEEALDAYRKGLDDDPDSVECLVGLAGLIPPGAKEFTDRLAKVRHPEDTLEALAEEFAGEGKVAALEPVVQAYRTRRADDPRGDYYAAELAGLKGDFAAAAAILKKALPRVDDDELRQDFIHQFLQTSLSAGQALDAYRAAPDSRQAFQVLADHLAATDNVNDLDRLLEAHGAKAPDDVWLCFFRGQSATLHKRYADADKAYAEGMARKLDDAARDRFRAGRVYARYLDGKGLSAYQELGPKKDTFDQLARLYSASQQPEPLEKLVQLHRQGDPMDSDIALWEAEVKWLRRDYAGAAKTLENHRIVLLDNEENWPRFADRLIRSLARAKQYDAARVAAEEAAVRDQDPWYLAVVAAVAGDLGEAEKQLSRCRRLGHDIAEFYEDPDLGPALRSDRLQPLRAKYPPPAP